MTAQQGDVKLFQTPDGGDITVENGVVSMDGGLDTAAYLSLFGGNRYDPANVESSNNWWGNLVEPDPLRRYRSETQFLLDGLAAIPANLRRVESAVERDLAWLTESGAASSVEAAASMPGPKRIKIRIKVQAVGEELQFEFTENWRAGE